MMNRPLILLVAPLIFALVSLLLGRRLKASAAFSSLALIVLILILATVRFDPITSPELSLANTWVFLGRSFILDEQVRRILLTAYAVTLATHLLYWLVGTGRLYLPLTVAVLSPLSAALMATPVLYGALFLFVSSCLLAILIQNGRAGSTLASTRELILITFAMPLLLLSASISAGSQTPFLSVVTLLIVLALLLLLGGFPFHIRIAPLFKEAEPFVPVIVYGAVQVVIIGYGFDLLFNFPAVQGSSTFGLLLRASSMATLILGALFALTANSLSALVSYLLMIDVGSIILAVSFGGLAGYEASMLDIVPRLFSLLLVAVGRQLILKARDDSANAAGEHQQAASTGSEAFGYLLLLFGGLSLAGVPLTPGFAGRWHIASLAGDLNFWLMFVLILCSVTGAFAFLRFIIASRPESLARPVRTIFMSSNCAEAVVTGVLLTAGILSSIFPRILTDAAAQLFLVF